MLIQINTDKNIEGGEALSMQVEASIEATLGRFREQLTRIEVHLSDENGQKSGSEDKKCVMEARPAGMQPLAVTHKAGSVDLAIDGAADKLERLLDSTFRRLNHQKGSTSYGGDQNV